MYLFMKKTLVLAAFVTFVPVMLIAALFAYPVLFQALGDIWANTGTMAHNVVFAAVAALGIFVSFRIASH